VETITIVAWIEAPIERCFDAARDLDLHVKSVSHTKERAVAGRTSGLIGAGEEVTWRARHFGITQHFTSRITAFDRPQYFQDTMQRGAFKSFVHDHFFERDQGKTKMTETLRFSAPLGFLGRIAEKLILRRYVHDLLELRVATIKEAAESPPWRGQ
jgi:ligand-binding SRPBCC domain-containing protein